MSEAKHKITLRAGKPCAVHEEAGPYSPDLAHNPYWDPDAPVPLMTGMQRKRMAKSFKMLLASVAAVAGAAGVAYAYPSIASLAQIAGIMPKQADVAEAAEPYSPPEPAEGLATEEKHETKYEPTPLEGVGKNAVVMNNGKLMSQEDAEHGEPASKDDASGGTSVDQSHETASTSQTVKYYQLPDGTLVDEKTLYEIMGEPAGYTAEGDPYYLTGSYGTSTGGTASDSTQSTESSTGGGYSGSLSGSSGSPSPESSYESNQGNAAITSSSGTTQE